MTKRWTPEAKAKEKATREILGPRLGRSPRADFKPTALPRTPRATGSTTMAMSDHKQ